MAEKELKHIVRVSSSKDEEGKVLPNVVTIAKEGDLTPDLIFKDFGKSQGLHVVLTVGGKKLAFDAKTGVLVKVFGVFVALLLGFAFTPRAQAQEGQLGKFRNSLEYASVDAPVCLVKTTSLVITCYSGNIYEGAGPVAAATSSTNTVGGETGVQLTLTASMTACPTTGTCNFIYADSSGTLHTTTTLATAWGTGNAPLYFMQTSASGVTLKQSVWQNTRPIFSLSLPTPLTDSGTQLTSTEPVVEPASTASLASTNIPAGTAPTTCVAGDQWLDSTQKAFTICPIAADPLYVSTALTTLHAQTAITTVTTIQALNSTTVTVPAGAMNVAGKTLHVKGYFVFSNGATTPTLTVTLKLGSVLMSAPVSAANANSNSSSPVWFEFYATTVGTGASGTLEAHGYVMDDVADATAGHPLTFYPDYLAAVSSAVDLTAAENITVNLTASATVTTATLRLCTFEISD